MPSLSRSTGRPEQIQVNVPGLGCRCARRRPSSWRPRAGPRPGLSRRRSWPAWRRPGPVQVRSRGSRGFGRAGIGPPGGAGLGRLRGGGGLGRLRRRVLRGGWAGAGQPSRQSPGSPVPAGRTFDEAISHCHSRGLGAALFHGGVSLTDPGHAALVCRMADGRWRPARGGLQARRAPSTSRGRRRSDRACCSGSARSARSRGRCVGRAGRPVDVLGTAARLLYRHRARGAGCPAPALAQPEQPRAGDLEDLADLFARDAVGQQQLDHPAVGDDVREVLQLPEVRAVEQVLGADFLDDFRPRRAGRSRAAGTPSCPGR